jgi:hypothetical protein
MTLQQFLTLMTITTLVLYVVFASVVVYFDPTSSGAGSYLFFYLSLGLSLVGSFTIGGYFLRRFFTPKQIAFRDIMTASRQAVLLSILVLMSLWLKQINGLSFMNVTLLIVFLAAAEFFILSKKQ